MLDPTLDEWLIARGYRKYPAGAMACIYSGLYQKRVDDVPLCEANDHTSVNVWVADVMARVSPSLSVQIIAQAKGRWYCLEAYGLPHTTQAIEAAEESVKAAWRAVAGDK